MKIMLKMKHGIAILATLKNRLTTTLVGPQEDVLGDILVFWYCVFSVWLIWVCVFHVSCWREKMNEEIYSPLVFSIIRKPHFEGEIE